MRFSPPETTKRTGVSVEAMASGNWMEVFTRSEQTRVGRQGALPLIE